MVAVSLSALRLSAAVVLILLLTFLVGPINLLTNYIVSISQPLVSLPLELFFDLLPALL